MAGHSKWANIRFRKAAQDARRGRIFTKLIREIVTAARLGGADEGSNPRLRSAVIAALSQNMTRDTIRRAIERGAGNAEGDNLENVVYEGYGAGGAAVLVECLTDNRNRTASDVRHAFAKFGGNIGAPGSVAYLFSKRGLLSFTPEEGRSVPSEEQAMEIALEAGADDVVVNDDGSVDIFTPPESFAQVADAFEKAGLRPVHAQLTQLASSEAALDAENAARFQRMLEALEELDDVQEVYHNATLPELPD